MYKCNNLATPQFDLNCKPASNNTKKLTASLTHQISLLLIQYRSLQIYKKVDTLVINTYNTWRMVCEWKCSQTIISYSVITCIIRQSLAKDFDLLENYLTTLKATALIIIDL